ncbi:MAG: LacI family DNA-binding transcriptional regulator [Shimia sp.]
MRNDIPKLEDVAQAAGVSTATVSRCLNGTGKVSPKTREKVEGAIRALGYAPNFGAQALAARRTNTFGAVVPTMDNAIFARGVQAFQARLAGVGVTTLIASSDYDPEREAAQIAALVARGADGLLLIGHDRQAQSYEMLDRRGIPYVVTWAHDAGQGPVCVGFDNTAAMRAMATEGLRMGHRRIAMISATVDGNDRARGRVAGVRRAMAAHGLEAKALRLIETRYSIRAGAEAFAALWPERPTLILCGNDVQAAGAMARAREMGVDVPGQVSITGFDDMDIAGITAPALTSVRVPHAQMGCFAARALMCLRAGQAVTSTKLETEIVLRGTLAPPPD